MHIPSARYHNNKMQMYCPETHALSDLPIRTLGSYDLPYCTGSHDRTEFDRGQVVCWGIPRSMARIG